MTPHFKRQRAFTLVEVIAILAGIGLVAGLAFSRVQNVREASRISKLQTDIATVNQAINIYIANGGRMTDVESHGFFGDPTEQKVLDKLKTRRNRFSAESYSGIVGEMIDKRVAVRMQSASQASSVGPRAVWDSLNNRFRLDESGTGVHEFYLNDELEEHDYGIDEGRRASALDVNPENGWIWTFEETARAERPGGLTEVVVTDPTNSDPDDGDPGGHGDDDDDDDDDGESDPLRGLARPKITPPGGIYTSSSFPLTITVENTNTDVPESWLMVSTNGGDYAYYEGAFTIPANSSVKAYAAGPPETYTNSSQASEYYVTQLQAPSFSPWPGNYPMPDYPLDVTIHHNNDPSTWVMYSIDGGPFLRYMTPLTIESDTALEAYVKSPSLEWMNSDSRSGTYGGYKVDLKVLSIDTSASEFDEDTDTISVTVIEPEANPEGSSEIRFAVTEKDAPMPVTSSFSPYGGTFENTYADYPNGFTVHAYAKSLDEEVWNDGPIRSVSTSVDFFGVGVAKSTLFMLDFSGSMDQQAYQSTLTRLEVLKEEMNNGLNALGEHDRFGVLIFSSVPQWVTTGGLESITSDDQTLTMHPGTDAAKAQVNTVVNSTMDQRFTNFLRALSVVDQISPQPEQIVFLTDGAPTVGDGSTEDLDNEWLAGLAEIVDLGIPIHTIGVDLRQQSRLDRLEYMADQSGGTSNLVGDPNLIPDEWEP